MANTRIQIRRSNNTSSPPVNSLLAGELAYSYNSDKLFTGNVGGNGIIEIGGGFYSNLALYAAGRANTAAASGMDYPYVNSAAAAANSWANLVGAASNTWANTVGAASNTRSDNADTAGNNYTSVLVANNALGANNWANSKTANVLGTTGRVWANTTTTGGYNNVVVDLATSGVTAATYGSKDIVSVVTVDAYGRVTSASNVNIDHLPANNYANATFVKLTAASQTITGDLAITGNLTLLGNATSISSNNLVVNDSLIYLANNNYSGTDLLDIGFVANYGNATSHNVHTGLIRDATNKQYYLFNGLDIELNANNTLFTPGANGVVNAILNADLVAANITLGGQTFTPSNPISSNNYVNSVGAASNTWANTVGAASNTRSDNADTAGNNYASVLVANNALGANNWANTKTANIFGTSGRTTVAYSATGGYNNATIDLATSGVTAASYGGQAAANINLPMLVVDTYGRITAAANQAINYGLSNIAFATANGITASFTTTNGFVNANISLTSSGVTPTSYGGPGTVPSFVVDIFGRLTAAGNNTISIPIDTGTTGTLSVSRGGTGNTTFAANSILMGNGTTAIIGVSSSTEGHVLQIGGTGIPLFSMLDGGGF